ncbi:MAG: LysR family transcriptional regulator [Pseudoruegeria sp.]
MDLFTSMRTFVEVVHAGSMNGAAQRLNVTSTLVGQRIAALEAHLQVKLLNRTTRQQSLTKFGESYLEHCRDILDMVLVSEGKANDQQDTVLGSLRIAAPVSFGTSVLVPALKQFSDAVPGVEIELILSDTNEDLIAAGIDVAFRIGRLEDSTLLQTKLSPYRMTVCASPDVLKDQERPISPSDLARFQAVLFSKTGRRPWRFSKGVQFETWTPQATLSVNSGQAVRMAVLAGMGIAMLPEVLVRDDFAAGRITRVLSDWDLPEQPMSLVYHRDRYRPQRLVKFIDFAREYF